MSEVDLSRDACEPDACGARARSGGRLVAASVHDPCGVSCGARGGVASSAGSGEALWGEARAPREDKRCSAAPATPPSSSAASASITALPSAATLAVSAASAASAAPRCPAPRCPAPRCPAPRSEPRSEPRSGEDGAAAGTAAGGTSREGMSRLSTRSVAEVGLPPPPYLRLLSPG